jgi:hypothetical protein
MGAKCIVLVTKKIVMHEWIHICSDVDNGQKMKKITRTFCELGMRPLISFLKFQKRNWDYIFHANEPYSTL